MSKTPEGKVKDRVKALLDEYGAYHNWPVPGGYGIPMLDCVGCHRGVFFAIETKATLADKLTPRQEFTKSQMELAGATVFVISGGFEQSFIELEEWLRDIQAGIKEPPESWLKRK